MKSAECRAWGQAALYAVLIFFLSSRPDLPDVEFFIEINDKVAHFILYTPLGFLLRRALTLRGTLSSRQTAFLAVLLGVLYGISDEFHQAFVPGRYADPADVVADAVGVWFGGQLYQMMRNRTIGTGLRTKTHE